MDRLARRLVTLLEWIAIVTAILVVAGVVISLAHGGSMKGWIDSMLIYGGGALFIALAIAGGFVLSTGRPGVGTAYLRTLSVNTPAPIQRSPVIILVPLGVLGIAALVHLYL